jgi:hypothetical protein
METTLGICHIGTVSTEEIAVEIFWLYVKFKESESQSSYQSRPFESMHGSKYHLMRLWKPSLS